MRRPALPVASLLFFFNDTATTEIYTLSLHDALPILPARPCRPMFSIRSPEALHRRGRSEEHTSELQSHLNLVCRLLLEKKKNTIASTKSLLMRTSYVCFTDHWSIRLVLRGQEPKE